MDDQLNATALLLVQHQLLTNESALQYQRAAARYPCRFLTYLVLHAQFCSQKIAQLFAQHYDFPIIDLNSIDRSLLPQTFLTVTLLRQYHILPIKKEFNQLYVATDEPNHRLLQDIQFITGCAIIPLIMETRQLHTIIEDLLRETDHQGLTHYLHNHIAKDKSLDLLSESLSNSQDETPIVAFVQRILYQALLRGATDLHFEPYKKIYRIRCRQDGRLYELARPPLLAAVRITARLKIMGDLDITERRLPQDGSFSVSYMEHKNIECRISTCPTIFGEKIALRFLNNSGASLTIEQLGFTDRDRHCFLQALAHTQGLIIITGPTGSGKTVSLYAALQHLNTGDKNISCAEDPVEMRQFGINQVQINPKIGLGFATVLKTFLRQDPDIIMLGEIRDYETADIAMKAAHTGHLVLTSLHTNHCAQTIVRLKQLGIPTFILGSALKLIIAQRLIRVLCVHCKIHNTILNTYQPKGCHRCQLGYLGRKAIFEVMPISPAIQTLIFSTKCNVALIKKQAQDEGMISLEQAGLYQVYQGITDIEEINKII